MFTGIVEHQAIINAVEVGVNQRRLWLESQFEQLELGESIAVDGICLTVAAIDGSRFAVDISPETLQVTQVGHYQVGNQVNVERAAKINDRLGGHIVTGHIDQVLVVQTAQTEGEYYEITFAGVKPEYQNLLVAKGSVTINGVSLTINRCSGDQLSVMLIPHTLMKTNLARLTAGCQVNVEFDYAAKLIMQRTTIQMPLDNINQQSKNDSGDAGRVSVAQALERLQQGKMVIVVDAQDRENEGDLVLAAQHVTPEAINFMSQFGRGLICMPMASSEFNRLQIPFMVQQNQSKLQTAFGVGIGAAQGVTTGISAYDRAATIKIAANPHSGPQDIIMPGHVFPLCAREGGLLTRNGHTEASVDLMKLAGLTPAAVICEVMNPDGTMARLPDLIQFAKKHDVGVLMIEDILRYRLQHENIITPTAHAQLPLDGLSEFRIVTFSEELGPSPVVIIKEPLDPQRGCLVRIHSECLTGDVLGSKRCDCGPQLHSALAAIDKEGGLLIYLRQEGRGIGLINKIKAYALQDQGMDTVEANHELGFSADLRDYAMAAQVLKHFSINKVRLLTNNPAKLTGLTDCGIEVLARVPLEIPPSKQNINYLKTKRDKLGHLLSL